MNMWISSLMRLLKSFPNKLWLIKHGKKHLKFDNGSSSTFCNLSSLLRIESTSFTFPGPTVPWASVRGAAGLGRLALRWGSGSPKPQTPAPGQPLVGTDQPGNWVTPRPGRPLFQRLISKWFEVKLSLSTVISFSYFDEGFRGFRNVVGCMEHFCTSLMGDGSADKTPAHKQKIFKKANAHKRKGLK